MAIERLTEALVSLSIAIESDTRASDGVSIAIESDTRASDGVSIAIESDTRASGGVSIAIESDTRASDSVSIAIDSVTERIGWRLRGFRLALAARLWRFQGGFPLSLTLFEHPLSPYARKVKIVLYEKGIAFDRVHVEPLRIKADDSAYGAFAAAGPRLEVPCLVDGEFRCFDSTIIVDYIDERWPERPMLPAAPEARARARMVEEICDGSFDAINWGLMELRFFRRASGEAAERMAGKAGEQLGRIWDRLELDLERRPWMSGDSFGRADASLIVHMTAAALFGFMPADRHSRLREWTARCLGVSGVQRDAADLAAYMGGEGPRGMRRGPIDRQYRDHRLEWMIKTGGVDVVLAGMKDGTIHFAAWP